MSAIGKAAPAQEHYLCFADAAAFDEFQTGDGGDLRIGRLLKDDQRIVGEPAAGDCRG
jgi:hypothetical protein